VKPAVAFTIVDDRCYYPEGTPVFINSFKRFHPDIPLVVFRQETIERVFSEKGVNFFCAKPVFARRLCGDYELVVNIDADTVITGRLAAVFDQMYDVGGAWNFNDYENASFDNIKPEMYVQAGMVGSRQPRFWEIWERENVRAMNYIRKENDILNLVWHNDPEVSQMARIFYDREFGYYGCKSLNREKEFVVRDNQLWCRGEPVRAYHHAKGFDFPKLSWDRMNFTPEVKAWLNGLSRGITVTYA